MHSKKKARPQVKAKLHPRNRNRERYDFQQLIATCPELAPFVRPNPFDDESIDFANAKAVRVLNKALLMTNYGLAYWDIPENYLCPPIPGRADYIHHMADLLARSNGGKIPAGPSISGLDIGTGASCIYPIIGTMEYGWSFIGSDIDPVAIESANNIIARNHELHGKINCRLQTNPKNIFRSILQPDESVDFTVCNPPFHASAAEAQAGTMRKLRNLHQRKASKPTLNFGGQSNELWCEGGEAGFVRTMIQQSQQLAGSCFWFSTLISKQANLKIVYQALKLAEAVEVETIPMGQGNKTSRAVAWTFLSKTEQQQWKNSRWKG